MKHETQSAPAAAWISPAPSTRCTIGVGSEYRVVGYDPEMADLDNPRGELVEVVFFLLATDADGNRWMWGSFSSLYNAEVAISQAPPIVTWFETYPEYGSLAFQQYGEEDLLAWEGRHVDAEVFGDRFYVA